MENIKIYASCENCGYAWTKTMLLPKEWGKIECPECNFKTENFDEENHNEDMEFINLDYYYLSSCRNCKQRIEGYKKDALDLIRCKNCNLLQ